MTHKALIVGIGGREPRVDGDAFVAPTASVIGDVTLEAGASVWYGAVVRGDVECEHCGRSFDLSEDVGRPRKYCRRSCRQRAYERRRHQGDLAWGDARLVGMARELAELEDRLDRARDLVDQLRFDVEDGRQIDESVLEDLSRALGMTTA